MHQYILLRGVAQFTVEEPDTGETFYLTPKTSSFVNYSFASDFELPFFYSVDRMDQHLMSVRGTKGTTFDQQRESVRPSDLQYLYSVSKRFIAESWGEQFKRGDEIYQLIKHIYDHVDFFTSKSSSKLPDGGWPRDGGEPRTIRRDDGQPPDPELDEHDGYSLGVVQIDIGPANSTLEDHDGYRLEM
uniref:hypothetical protein n=1 Tax=Haloprofundus sp. MHR1 TaxID=2572921 RepID=UPI001F3E85CD|nr:hypothetical protein [Haloprofundus sp. MHR1]